MPRASRDGQTSAVFYSATPNELCKSSNGLLPSTSVIHCAHRSDSTLKQHLATNYKYVCFTVSLTQMWLAVCYDCQVSR